MKGTGRRSRRGGGLFFNLSAFFLFLLCCAAGGQVQAAASFSKDDIISPVAGTWGNKQPLVLNVPDGCEAYYSLSGSDPLLFGFVYDGPSLIDKEGDVQLKIATVDRAGRRSDYSIDYRVQAVPLLEQGKRWGAEQKNFVRMISANPIRKYTAGTVFSIPKEFSYSVGPEPPDGGGRIFAGSMLSFGAESSVVRFVPFTVTDGETRFRFVVRTAPSQENLSGGRQLPFRISDWETLVPLDRGYSFRIDDGIWHDGLSSLRLDRSETHVLFWKLSGQDDEAGRLVLYPKPSLACALQADGSCRFSLKLPPPYLSGYRLGRSGDPSAETMKCLTPASGLYSSIVMDAFNGEDISGTFVSGVYLDGVYQGDLSAPYRLDRLPPPPPEIVLVAGDGNSFSDEQEVRIVGEAGSRLFYAVSGGRPVEAGDATGLQAELSGLPQGELYRELDGGSIFLATAEGRASCYRVLAYALDAAGNRGEAADLPLLVTGRNIYLRLDAPADSGADGRSGGNGSYEAPFLSFVRAVEAINANERLTLHIDGDVSVREDIEICSPCVIEGNGSCLSFSHDAALVVRGADVVFSRCSLLREDGDDGGGDFSAGLENAGECPVFIRVQDGRILFRSCDVSARFLRGGRLMELDSSGLQATASSFSAYSSSYASLLAAYTSKVDITDSSCAAASYTTLVFCMVDSDFRLENSVASVSCYTGRIAEFSGGSLLLRGNVFAGSLRAEGALGSLSALRVGEGTRELALDANKIRGFKE